MMTFTFIQGVRPVKALLMLTLFVFSVGTSSGMIADAKKKAAATVDPAAQADGEVKKGLEPLNDVLNKLMIKLQSRALLSPEDAGKLADMKYKLLDLVGQYPQNAQLAKPMYQAAVLFTQREAYDDAYEMFSNLVQGYADTPYGIKAKGQLQQMDKKFGPGFFAEAVVSSTSAPATATSNTPSAKK